MYAATIDGQALSFDVAGVWRRNMVIRDRQTGSVWQQATGEAIAGSLKGRKLAPQTSMLMDWLAWQTAHPAGILATEPDPPAPNLFSVHKMVRLFGGTRHFTTPGLSRRHDLPNHAIVIGIELDGKARAYPLDTLRTVKHVKNKLAGITIILQYHEDGDYVEAATEDGTPIHAERQWWLGWSEFHPNTDVY